MGVVMRNEDYMRTEERQIPGSAGVPPAELGGILLHGGRDARAPRDYNTLTLARNASFGSGGVLL